MSVIKHSQIQNYFQSLLLLMAMMALMAFLGYLLAGIPGLLILMIAGALVLMSVRQLPTRFIMYIYGAQLINRHQLPAIYNILDRLSERAGINRIPQFYYLPSPAMLAFSIGTRNDEAVVLSDAMLRKLNIHELTAVLAHEISHIYNRDIWVMMVADIISRFTAILALIGYILIIIYLPVYLFSGQEIPWLFIIMLMLAPNISAMMQLALSRTREYSADANAARLTGDPEALISALNKIEYYQEHWLQRILMPGRRLPDPSLLRTHPKTTDRINRLLDIKESINKAPQINHLEVDLTEFKPYHRKSERRFLKFWD